METDKTRQKWLWLIPCQKSNFLQLTATATKRSEVVHKSEKTASNLYEVLSKTEDTIQELTRMLVDSEDSTHMGVGEMPKFTPKQQAIQKELAEARRRYDMLFQAISNG